MHYGNKEREIFTFQLKGFMNFAYYMGAGSFLLKDWKEDE
jgi:hypothetical protein